MLKGTPFLNLLLKKTYCIYLVCVHLHEGLCAHVCYADGFVDVRGQLSVVSSSLPCGEQGQTQVARLVGKLPYLAEPARLTLILLIVILQKCCECVVSFQ